MGTSHSFIIYIRNFNFTLISKYQTHKMRAISIMVVLLAVSLMSIGLIKGQENNYDIDYAQSSFEEDQAKSQPQPQQPPPAAQNVVNIAGSTFTGVTFNGKKRNLMAMKEKRNV